MSRILTYNELNGEETAAIIKSQLTKLLENTPYFKRHLTFPRVRITLQVTLEMWADQPSSASKQIELNDKYDVIINDPALFEMLEGEISEAAAPVPGGFPPDKLRAIHGLPISRPGPGERDIGGHAYTADVAQIEEGEVEGNRPGLKITRGLNAEYGGTSVVIDPGPAGLRQGQMRRQDFGLRHGTPADKIIAP